MTISSLPEGLTEIGPYWLVIETLALGPTLKRNCFFVSLKARVAAATTTRMDRIVARLRRIVCPFQRLCSAALIMAESGPKPFGKPWLSVRRRSSDTVARPRRWDPGRPTAWHRGCRSLRRPIRTRMLPEAEANAAKQRRAPAGLLLPSWLLR